MTDQQWQPIETAPRDGSWFVVARQSDDNEDPEYEVGRYDPFFHRKFHLREDGLYEAEDVMGYEWCGFNNFQRATHWMPLPPAPDQAQ